MKIKKQNKLIELKDKNSNEIMFNDSAEDINVVFITDENYALSTAVACNSLIKNKNDNSNINIFIVTTGLTNNVRHWFEASKVPSVVIHIIEIKNNFEYLALKHQHVSPAALIKFDLPNIFPKLNKILYLDSDVIISSDITSLFQTSIEECYAAVVKDFAAMRWDHHVKINHKNYFNSGVMLLNLVMMRNKNITTKLIDIKAKKLHLHFMDQDEFNIAFEEKVFFLSPTYNFMERNFYESPQKTSELYEIPFDEFQGIIKSPCIQHLTNIPKVWNNPKDKYFQSWFYFLPDILFNDYIQELDNFSTLIESSLKENIELLNSEKISFEKKLDDVNFKMQQSEAIADAKIRESEAIAEAKIADAKIRESEAIAEAKIADAKIRESEAKAKESEAKAKESEAKAKVSEAKAKESEAKAKESEAKAKVSEAKAKESEAKAKESEAKAKESEAKAKESEAKAKESEAKAKESEAKLCAIYRSKSWRITAPLRWPVYQVRLLLQFGLKIRINDLVRKILKKLVPYVSARPALRAWVKRAVYRLGIAERLKPLYRSNINLKINAPLSVIDVVNKDTLPLPIQTLRRKGSNGVNSNKRTPLEAYFMDCEQGQ
jgi:lipopolysaccharide biosynthesis glycosyltransferase